MTLGSFDRVIENSKAYYRNPAAFDAAWAKELAGGSLPDVM